MRDITKAQDARRDAILDSPIRTTSMGVTTWRNWLAAQPILQCAETDAMIEWSRTKFNRMDHKQQAAYEARLKAKRLYWVNGVQVPRTVYIAAGGEG